MVAGVEYRHIRAWHETQTSPGYSPALSADNVIHLARFDGAPQDVYRFCEPGSQGSYPGTSFFDAGERVWLRWSSLVLAGTQERKFYGYLHQMRQLAGIATSEQVTEAVVFGSGALQSSWWLDATKVGWDYTASVDAPDGWIWEVTGDHPDHDDESVTVRVSHERLMHAARRIVDGYAGDGVRISTEREAALLIWSPDDADFDACAADELLQVAVYGEVHYG